jgi:aconitate hydratase
MGVIPLQFPNGQNAESLGLTGSEEFSFTGIEELNAGSTPRTLRVVASPTEHTPAGATLIEFDAVVRIDTPGEADYYRNGGILQYVLRSLL